MPSLTHCCGFECAFGTNSGTPHLVNNGGTAFDTSIVDPAGGSRSIRCHATASSTDFATMRLPAGSTSNVATISFYIASNPTTDCIVAGFYDGSGTCGGLAYKSADGKCYVFCGGATITFGTTGTTVSTGAWHTLDISVDSSSTTWVVSCAVDGTTVEASVSFSGRGVSSISLFRFADGFTPAKTYDMYFDNAAFSTTAADYPLGARKVLGFVAASDGTHTATTTHIVKGTTGTPVGTAITSATTDAFNWLNGHPTGGATDGTRLINQQTAASTEYVEFGIEQTTEANAPEIVVAQVIYFAAGTQAATASYKLVDNGTEDVIKSLTAGVNTDVAAYKIYTTMPSGGSAWTLARFKAIKFRFGYSSDATPDMYVRGFVVEASFTIPAGNVTVTPGKASLTLTRFTPSVVTPRTVTPGVAALTTTKFAPSVRIGVQVVPGVKALALSPQTPTVTATQNKVVTPGTVAVAITRFAPSVLTPRLVTPGVVALTITRFAPTIRTPVVVTPGTKALTLTGFVPTVLTPRTVTPGTKSVVITVFAPVVTAGTSSPQTVTPGVVALTLTRFAPTISASNSTVVTPATVSLVVSPKIPSVTAPALVTPGVKTTTITRFAPVVTAPAVVTPPTRALVLTRLVPTVTAPAVVTPGVKATTITRFAPSVVASDHKTVVPGVATLTLTRFSPVIAATANVLVVPGNAALTITRYAPDVSVGHGGRGPAVVIVDGRLVLRVSRQFYVRL